MMFCYYIERGHDIKELTNLSPLEKMFYKVSMELVNEENKKAGGEN